jgi:hypothetical protein
MFGAPALLFANRYFSPNRFRRMIKGLRKKDIQNAAWDLTLVQNWRRAALKGIKGTQPAILMSDDKAVKDIARRITAETDAESQGQLCEPWGHHSRDGRRVFDHYMQLWSDAQGDPDRSKKIPNYEKQLTMIDNLERSVLS